MAAAEKEIADAAKNTQASGRPSVYSGLATRLSHAGIYSEEAEEYARKGLAEMDEREYMDSRKQQYERDRAVSVPVPRNVRLESRTRQCGDDGPRRGRGTRAPVPVYLLR